MRSTPHSILLVLPVPFRENEGRLGFDAQTCRHIACWAERFDRVFLACPSLPMETAVENASVESWHPIDELDCAHRIETLPLPEAYRLPDFIRTYGKVRSKLRQLISSADYLCFSPGALIGDWAAIAALEAKAQQRDYAIWVDRVEYEITWKELPSMSWKSRLKHAPLTPLTKWYHHYIMRNASLGLLQGKDCYDTFAPSCRQPHLIYFVHIQARDRINPAQLDAKLNALQAGSPLRIAYAGRAAQMKGPLDWLRAVDYLVQAGVSVEANWFGAGPMLNEMQAMVEERGLTDTVMLHGFQEHNELLEQLKQSHIFMFCHNTPESARCLVEALMCGCALVGYESPYPKELVSQSGGGLFAPVGDWQSLAGALVNTCGQPGAIAALIRGAAQSGQRFSEESVFQQRQELICRYLKPKPSGPSKLPIDSERPALPEYQS